MGRLRRYIHLLRPMHRHIDELLKTQTRVKYLNENQINAFILMCVNVTYRCDNISALRSSEQCDHGGSLVGLTMCCSADIEVK